MNTAYVYRGRFFSVFKVTTLSSERLKTVVGSVRARAVTFPDWTCPSKQYLLKTKSTLNLASTTTSTSSLRRSSATPTTWKTFGNYCPEKIFSSSQKLKIFEAAKILMTSLKPPTVFWCQWYKNVFFFVACEGQNKLECFCLKFFGGKSTNICS